MEEIPSELPDIRVIDTKVEDSIEIGDDEEEIEIRRFKEYTCFFITNTHYANSIPSNFIPPGISVSGIRIVPSTSNTVR